MLECIPTQRHLLSLCKQNRDLVAIERYALEEVLIFTRYTRYQRVHPTHTRPWTTHEGQSKHLL